ELHIILPYPVDRFRELSVASFGDPWLARFDALVAEAASLEILTELPDEAERSLGVAVELADLVAMGQCVRNATVLNSRPKALTITAKDDEPRRQYKTWSDTGHDQFTIAVSRKADHKSVAMMSEKATQEIAAILWVDHSELERLLSLPEGAHDFQRIGDAHYRISTDLAELIAAGRSLLHDKANSRISFLIDIMNPQKPATSLLEQAGDMARASGGGAIMTDHRSAMVLTLQSAGLAIEEIGELQSARGPLSLWSVA
ncbi:hypothetical protein, partial [Parasphingorhabdus sp.]|uniref:hypothetical protein n=1 Tax=Parasphingorhabdus sp. TaxID=2709688 RepID=UPI00359378E4